MANTYIENSVHAEQYSKFRISAPQALTSRIISFLNEKEKGPLQSALDVGCGSGQSTFWLSDYFKTVTGVDASEDQINVAVRKNSHPNVKFKVSSAENLQFESQSFQLVTVGEACHWFDVKKFYQEVDRLLVPNGVIAVYGYPVPHLVWENKSEALTKIMHDIGKNELIDYFPKGLFYVEECCKDELFVPPFPEHTREDDFKYEHKATVREIAGYISSWSGFQKYRSLNGEEAAKKILDNFVEKVMKTINVTTSPEETELTFSYNFFLILGRKNG